MTVRHTSYNRDHRSSAAGTIALAQAIFCAKTQVKNSIARPLENEQRKSSVDAEEQFHHVRSLALGF